MFYDKFVYLCNQKGVSPTRAAIDAGISKSLVTKWKVSQVQVPSPDVLKKLSVYFNVPVSTLLGEEIIKAPTEKVSADILDEVDIGFYNGYKELDETDKEVLRDMVRVMRERRSKKNES